MYWLLHKTWFHGSQILRTIWLLILFHQTCPFIKGKSSCTMWRSSFGINHTCIGVIRRCVPECEMLSVLEACHSSPVGGHHSGIRTARKILQCGYYWPTLHQDAHGFAKACDRCQWDGGISRKQELPLNPILVIELFDVWVIDFMGPLWVLMEWSTF